MRGVVLGVILLVSAGSHAGPGAGAPATCTVTGFRLTQSDLGGGALQLLPQGGGDGCFGAYAFLGVSAGELGEPTSTRDRFRELAQALRRWTPEDGVPAVDQWVRFASPLADGMRAAGIHPAVLLQWLNGSNAGIAADAGLWPPFVRRARITDPARSLGAPTGPPVPAAPPPVGQGARPAVAARVGGGASVRGARPASPARQPPSAVVWRGVTVPCAVAPTCRPALLQWDAWRGLPLWRRWAARLWSWRAAGLAVGALVGVGGLALLARPLWPRRSRR